MNDRSGMKKKKGEICMGKIGNEKVRKMGL